MRQAFMQKLNKADTIQGTSMPLFNHADLYADFAYLPGAGLHEYAAFTGKYGRTSGRTAYGMRC